MKTTTSEPIPIPFAQRWRDTRLRLLPRFVFGLALVAIACLWHTHVAAPAFVGQAEPVVANVNSVKPGMLAELNVIRFQKVKAGDIVGRVLVADPQILSASLAVVTAEIDNLKATMSPLIQQQRNAVDYAQLRLDWMRQRADLASTRVNLQLAEAELRREDELFKNKLISESERDIALANRDALQKQADELAKLVADGENNFTNMQPAGAEQLSHLTDDPLRAAIAVQESKLRLTEAELSPIPLKVPMDGVVTAINLRPGEAVTAGQPVVVIAALEPVRIVGYLRPPDLGEPRVGMKVEVRTRGWHRVVGTAQVVAVGSQLESLPAVLAGALRLTGPELGLPVDISLPPNLNLRPGELVDITLAPKND